MKKTILIQVISLRRDKIQTMSSNFTVSDFRFYFYLRNRWAPKYFYLIFLSTETKQLGFCVYFFKSSPSLLMPHCIVVLKGGRPKQEIIVLICNFPARGRLESLYSIAFLLFEKLKVISCKLVIICALKSYLTLMNEE